MHTVAYLCGDLRWWCSAVPKGHSLQEMVPINFKATFQSDKYTAFDIWCAGAFQKTFHPIKDDHTFWELLLRSCSFSDVFDKMSEGL